MEREKRLNELTVKNILHSIDFAINTIETNYMPIYMMEIDKFQPQTEVGKEILELQFKLMNARKLVNSYLVDLSWEKTKEEDYGKRLNKRRN